MGEALSYSVKGAAAAVGVSETSVWRWIRAKEIKTFKLGGRTLILRTALEDFINRKVAA